MVNLLYPDIVSRSLLCIFFKLHILGIAVFILYALKVMAQDLNSLPKLSQLVSCGATDFKWNLLYTASHVFCIMLPQSSSVIMFFFFFFLFRQNPETTFEVYVEVAYPRTGGTLSGTHLSNFDNDVSL